MALLEPGVLVALAERDREQRAVGAEAPGVIGTAEEFSGIAAGFRGDACAFVRTAVVEDLHRVVAVTHHEHRLRADRGAEIIAGIGDLAVVADIDPGIGEQVLHLELEHFVVDIDVAVDFGVPDQAANSFGIPAISGHRSLLARNHRSNTSRGVFDRDTQICISFPAVFSVSDKIKSR